MVGNINTDQGQQQPQNYQSNGIMQDNSGYFGATALEIRLNTRTVLSKIETNLRGSYIEQYQNAETGEWIIKEIKQGTPLVNEEGLQNIMNYLEMILNPQVAQGNFESFDMYFDYLIRTRVDLACFLMNNLHNFGLNPAKYDGVMSSIMRSIEAFMSRLVNDGERKSYAQTIRSLETLQTQQKPQGFRVGLFGR